MIDEILELADPSAIVLKHLESGLVTTSNFFFFKKKGKKQRKIIDVLKRILEALKVLYEDGYVHTSEGYAPSKLLTAGASSDWKFLHKY